jgi:hypothetical protein
MDEFDKAIAEAMGAKRGLPDDTRIEMLTIKSPRSGTGRRRRYDALVSRNVRTVAEARDALRAIGEGHSFVVLLSLTPVSTSLDVRPVSLVE